MQRSNGWIPRFPAHPKERDEQKRQYLGPWYFYELPTTDGWSSPLTCLSDGLHFVIVSPGRDQVVDGDYSAQLPARQTTDFDEDIVYSDGQFVIAPGF